jgi:hypothetical protein
METEKLSSSDSKLVKFFKEKFSLEKEWVEIFSISSATLIPVVIRSIVLVEEVIHLTIFPRLLFSYFAGTFVLLSVIFIAPRYLGNLIFKRRNEKSNLIKLVTKAYISELESSSINPNFNSQS